MSIVYGLCDPRSSGIRYVGMTKNSPHERLRSHCYESRNPQRRTTWRTRWIGSLLDEGVTPVVVMLTHMKSDDPGPLGDLEAFWIGRLRDMGHQLVNTAPGGEGRRGPMSDEAKRKMSLAGKGRPKSPETRARMSAAQKGRKKPPRTHEWRASHSAKMTGHKHSEETKRKIGDAQRGKPQPWTSEFAKQRIRGDDGKFI